MFRSLFLRLSVSLLPVMLFGFGLALSVALVLGNPNLIKSAVRDSGLYEVLIDDVFLQNQSVLGADIPVNDPGIRDAVQGAFTPQLLQASGDHIIDGTYAWLKGETATPQFNVDLTGAKAQAAENIATYASARAINLPLCSAAQVREIYASGLNLYTLTCRPPELSTDTIHNMVRGSLLTSTDFFKGAFVTAGSIQDANGQPLYQRLSFIPTVYQWTIKAVYFLGILAALAAAGVMFLSKPSRAGVKRVGITSLVVGGVSILFSVLLGFISSYVSEGITKISGSTEALQVKMSDIVHILITDTRYWWLRLAIAEVIVGIGLLVWLRMKRTPMISAPEHTSGLANPRDPSQLYRAPQDTDTPSGNDQTPWNNRPPQAPLS